MKSTVAITALFAALATATSSGWAITVTGVDWTSTISIGSGDVPTPSTDSDWVTSTNAAGSIVLGAPVSNEWTFTSSWEATYSSGSKTWAAPTVVTYSAGEGWTSKVPAASAPAPAGWGSSSAAPVATTPAATWGGATTSTSTKAVAQSTVSTFAGSGTRNGGAAAAGYGVLAAAAGLALAL